nr:MAG TPA: lipoprotein [Caudoviricetes sp.]
MKRIVYFLLLLLLLSCGSRKVKKEEVKTNSKERISVKKDSVSSTEMSEKTTIFDVSTIEHIEFVLESDKDSMGNTKELYFNRIRDGTNETITVRGGKVSIKANSAGQKSLVQEATILKNDIKTSVQRDEKAEKEMKAVRMDKQVIRKDYILVVFIIIFLIFIVVFRIKAP